MIYPGALGRYNRSAKLVGSIHDVFSVQDVIIKPGDDADIVRWLLRKVNIWRAAQQTFYELKHDLTDLDIIAKLYLDVS